MQGPNIPVGKKGPKVHPFLSDKWVGIPTSANARCTTIFLLPPICIYFSAPHAAPSTLHVVPGRLSIEHVYTTPPLFDGVEKSAAHKRANTLDP